MGVKTLELLEVFYNGEIPAYIKNATKTYVEILVVDKGRKKITMQDVIDYYLTEARNITSGCRTLAGMTGDWRNIDYLAKEILEWFKFSNIETLRKEGKKAGLIAKF